MQQNEILNNKQIQTLQTVIPHLEIFENEKLDNFIENLNRKIREWNPDPTYI
jgi:hypothetical protein